MNTATLIEQDGTTKQVSPANGTDFKLKELYNLLDCQLVEVAYLDNGDIMIIDEEGKLNAANTINEKATAMYRPRVDFIVGKALVCDNSMFQ